MEKFGVEREIEPTLSAQITSILAEAL